MCSAGVRKTHQCLTVSHNAQHCMYNAQQCLTLHVQCQTMSHTAQQCPTMPVQCPRKAPSLSQLLSITLSRMLFEMLPHFEMLPREKHRDLLPLPPLRVCLLHSPPLSGRGLHCRYEHVRGRLRCASDRLKGGRGHTTSRGRACNYGEALWGRFCSRACAKKKSQSPSLIY